MIYFDNSATTAINPQVLKTYEQTAQKIMGNPSSLHRLGEQAKTLLQKSRQQIADFLHCLPQEIVFTSGGTEGDNWVLKGTAIEKRSFGNHIIVSAVEHPAIIEAANQLQSLGFDIDLAPVNQDGRVDVHALHQLIRKETILVSVMAVNNEIGVCQPITEIAEILEEYPNIHFHVDAVQALGKIPLSSFLHERVDFATFSAHKFHGPRGCGFLYWKKGRRLAPLFNGGGQENGLRSGTENVPAIVAQARAVRLLMTDEEDKQRYERQFISALRESLSQYPDVHFFTPNDHTAPHILCFGIEGIRGEVLVHALEQHDIFISTTSACSSRNHLPAGTLNAMHVPTKLAETAVRISIDETNQRDDIAQFMSIFDHVYHQLSSINK